MFGNEAWCCDSRTIDGHCSPDLEVMSVQCRPFDMPCELTAITTAFYIPPDASTSTSLRHLQHIINKHQKTHPNPVHIIAGDFSHACLKTVLFMFHQQVKTLTRVGCLNPVYSNIKHAYRAVPLPHLGQSDHLSLYLIPAYTRFITTWPEHAFPQLQDCFAHTDSSIFEQQDLDS